MPTANIVPIRTGPRPARGRRPVPIRRRVFERIEDFSFTGAAEATFGRDRVRVMRQLLRQTPPRLDLVDASLDALDRGYRAIGVAARALTAVCEAEIASARPHPTEVA